MSDVSESRATPEPSELVYVPSPSWAPVLLAAGLTGVLVGLFAGWPYAVAGAVLGLASLRGWIRRTVDDLGRRLLPADHLHKLHPMHRIEKVQADHALRMGGALGDRAHRERRRVRGQDRFGRRQLPGARKFSA